MSRFELPRLFSAVLLVLALGLRAEAQIGPIPPAPDDPTDGPVEDRRPYRGLFGGGQDRPTTPGVTFLGSVFGGYDDNLLAQSGSFHGARVPGAFVGTSPSLMYYGVLGPVQLRASGATSWRWVSQDEELQNTSHAGDVDVLYAINRNWSLFAAESVRSSPYYQFLLTPGLPTPDVELPTPALLSPNADIVGLNILSHASTLGVTREGRRSTLRALYDTASTSYGDSYRSTHRTAAAASYDRQVSRYSTLVFGYGYQESEVGLDTIRSYTTHDINIGGGYQRPLSFSRRTLVSINGGTSMLTREEQRRYIARVIAGLQHELGQTWRVDAAYRQGIESVNTLTEPLTMRSIRTALGGFINRRTDLRFDGSYSNGTLLSSNLNPFNSFQGSARLRVGLTQSLAAYADYSYYSYEFESASGLPALLASQIRRNAVTAGVMIWVPVYTQRP